MNPKYVLFYQPADDVMDKVPQLFPEHSARIDEFHARGDILLVGTFGDPQTQGSMSVFPTREAAEAFCAGDPFVVHGAVKSYDIWQWNEVLGG